MRIFLGDSTKIAGKLGMFDHVIADPPYDAQVHKNSRRAAREGRAGSETRSFGFEHLDARVIDRMARVFGKSVRRWIVVFGSVDALQDGLHDWRRFLTKHGVRHVRTGLWVKTNATPQFTGDRPGHGFEAFEIAHAEGRSSWNGGGRSSIYYHASPRGSRHPAAKPTGLISEIIRDFTDPDELILDPFMGSGTVLRVAKDLGRRAVGIEIDESFVELAVARLAQETLFS